MSEPVQDTGAVLSPRAKHKQPTTWGRPRKNVSPRVIKILGRVMHRSADWCSYVIYAQLAAIVVLVLLLTFNTTFVRLFASNGTAFSCEVHTYNESRK
ncbi:hypothetical protein [Pandoraea communis]|uniref:hypothetical protein n=1 Tax=Pandoraea communis TaxID=2508297 RepID=UPI0025A53162|nr:hypothetical protein [Pandoraea communis]MDM8356510.1 hypothetical protein [Pandoraea communis]